MIPVRGILPILMAIAILACLLLSGSGLESLKDPIAIGAVLFLMAVGCVPWLRRVTAADVETREPSKLRKWLAKAPGLPGLISFS